MLFHASAHGGTGVDIEHISMRFDERLDLDRFRAAWRIVFDRHPILRASFDGENQAQPRVRFANDIEPPFTVEDWTSLGDDEVDRRMADVKRQDRLTDYPLDRAPLHRFLAAEIGSDRWWVLWSFHHAILDGRSFPLVLTEVLTLYGDGDNDRPLSSVEDELTDRVDFSTYLSALAERDLTEDRSYWTQKLQHLDAPSVVSLPLDPGAEPVDDATPAVVGIETELGLEATSGLRRLAESLDVTLNTCVQAAWSLLLSHYCQRSTVSFGVTRACRHAVDGARDMIGLLINTVPLVVDIDDDVRVDELLTTLRKEQVDLRQHETTPLPVIAACAPSSGSAPFDSIVVFDDASLDARMAAAFPATAERRRFDYEGQTNFALTLLGYGDDSLRLRLEFAIDRYDRAAASRMLDHVVNLLTGFVATPGERARDLAYLTSAEVARFEDWNRTEVAYDLDTTLVRLFEDQVGRTPDAVALRWADGELTYRRFNAAVNRLADRLIEGGVGPGVKVGVFTERSPEMLTAIYAIAKAGGCYVPFDPEHPIDRIAFMVEDSEVEVVLTQEALVSALPEGRHEALVVDGVHRQEPAGDGDADDPEPRAGPDDLAYLLYTSGSTGRPKGVMIEHRAIVNRLLWMQDAYRLDGNDCVLQKTPYTFDVSVWELFWPLQVGATLAIAEPGGHRDTAYLAETIERFAVTTLHFVPSMLALFVDEPTIGRARTVQRVICSGEALPKTLQDRLFDRLDVELHNLYGPTEAAVDVTWWACRPDPRLTTIPIGHPIANTTVHVLDGDGRRVPIGVQGELHIGGVQLARGYHNRPELTAERFVPDPYHPDPDARLYRTGDLVRHRADGAVEFLGRLDHQIKIRGQRVELGEIESVIAEAPAVREVVVAAVGDDPLDARLVAYVVADGVDDERDLVARCGRTLSDAMIPASWVFLDALPLNANGKVDRGRLPVPSTEEARQLVAPEGASEQQVLDLWTSLLGHDDIGVTDTFFDVGGNSLLLMRLAQLLAPRLGRPVAVKDLLRHTTVRQQAALGAGRPDDDADEAVTAGREQARARRAKRGRRRRVGT